MVDNYNFNVVPNDEQEEFRVEFGETIRVVEDDFNKLQNRPSYAGETMTGDTDIPEVPTAVSQLTNDADYQTWAEVNSAIGVEARARGDADDALQTAIGVVDGKVADEKTAREQADGVLQNNIEAEQTARQNADIGLQGQIDAITSASDVVDIVGTYAELQQYSTAKIKDNDVIKVLQDETHNNAMSYYRWSTSTSTWSYIGSEGPYYTKSESDTLLLAKQNKLTAGDNITIANNVISATDTNTTYTAGNAITIDSTDNNRIDAAIYPADFFTANATTSGIGSNITLDNTIPVKLDDVKLDGDTFQQTYSGINLLPPPDDFTQNVDGLNIVCTNGEYSINGKSSSGTTTGLKSTIAEYTIQEGDYFHYNNELISPRINIGLRFSDNTQMANSMNVANRIISLADYVGKTIVGVTVNFNSGFDFSGTAKPMILNGVSTVTPFEPYVGGIASPNPDYPQTINIVTGVQTITIGDGTDSQTYTVDLGSIELCKIGTYQDYIYKSGDDWYVYKETGKLEADGSESWSTSSSGNFFYLTNVSDIIEVPTNEVAPMVSNYYMATTRDALNNATVDYGIGCGFNSPRVYIRNKDIATAADFTTWLSTHNTTIYYALATPTDTKITDNTLIGQLNTLSGAQGYDDTTILTVSATGTNLPAILEVSAFVKSLKGLVGVIGRSEAN